MREKTLPFKPAKLATDPSNNVLIITAEPDTWDAGDLECDYLHDLNQD